MKHGIHVGILVGVLGAAALQGCGGDASVQPLSSLVVQDDAFTVAPLAIDGTAPTEVDPLANDHLAGEAAHAGVGGNVRLEILAAPDGVSLAADGKRLVVGRYGTGQLAVGYRLCTVQAPLVCLPGRSHITITRGAVRAEPIVVKGWTGDEVVGNTDMDVTWPSGLPTALRVSSTGAVRVAEDASPGHYSVIRRLCEAGRLDNCADQQIDVEVPQTVAVDGRYRSGEDGLQPMPAAWWSGPMQGLLDWWPDQILVCAQYWWDIRCLNGSARFEVDDLPLSDGLLAFSAARPLYWPRGFRGPARPGQRLALPAVQEHDTGEWLLPEELPDQEDRPPLLIREYSQGANATVGALPPVPGVADVPLRWQTGTLQRGDGSRPARARVALGMLSGQMPSVDMDAEIDGQVVVLEPRAVVFFDVRDDADAELVADGGYQLLMQPWDTPWPAVGTRQRMYRFDVMSSRWQAEPAMATFNAGGRWEATVDRPGLWLVADASPARLITGCLVDTWGHPAAQRTVWLSSLSRKAQAVRRTDADGRFSALMPRSNGQPAEIVVAGNAYYGAPAAWGFGTPSRTYVLSGDSSEDALGPCLSVDANNLLTVSTQYTGEDYPLLDEVWLQPGGQRQRFPANGTQTLQVGRHAFYSAVYLDGGWVFRLRPAIAERVNLIEVPGQATVRMSLQGAERHGEAEGRYWHLYDIDVDAACRITVIPRRVLVDSPPPSTTKDATWCVPA